MIKEFIARVSWVKTGLVCAGAAVAVVGVNYVRDMRQELQATRAAQATLAQKFEQKGTSGIAGNELVTSPQAVKSASVSFSPEVLTFMKQQNAALQSLTNALARIESTKTAAPVTLAAVTEHQSDAGVLTNLPMPEARGNLPPLSTVFVSYDPRLHDARAFQGTYWRHNCEQFTFAAGDWKAQKDGKLMTSVSAKRTVFDGPCNGTPLGVEDIPVADATTTYTPPALAPVEQVPRWTAMVGAARSGGVTRPAAAIDYRVSKRFGVWAGALSSAGQSLNRPQDSTFLGGVSYRF